VQHQTGDPTGGCRTTLESADLDHEGRGGSSTGKGVAVRDTRRFEGIYWPDSRGVDILHEEQVSVKVTEGKRGLTSGEDGVGLGAREKRSPAGVLRGK